MAIKIKSGYNSYKEIDPSDVLFLDVETVPMHPDFESLPEVFKPLWRDKARKYSYEAMTPEELYFEKAGIHAEFGKIVCISVGRLMPGTEARKPVFWIKSFWGHDERQLLLNFRQMLDERFHNPDAHFLCAHNGVEFDFPYIARRMLINSIPLPILLDISGSKSWDNRWLLDTMALWRFGDYKESTSLNLLAACFDIPSPKDDISGKDVARVYHHENDIERIKIYCQKDIVTLFRLFQRFSSLPMQADEDVQYMD